MRLGGWEIVLIVVVVLILFGAGKLPEVGSAIGKGIRSFRKGQQGIEEDEDEDEEEEVEPKKTTAKKKTTKKN